MRSGESAVLKRSVGRLLAAEPINQTAIDLEPIASRWIVVEPEVPEGVYAIPPPRYLQRPTDPLRLRLPGNPKVELVVAVVGRESELREEQAHPPPLLVAIPQAVEPPRQGIEFSEIGIA